MVENYEAIIETIELPDPDDRHVLAAAIHCRANAIVTFNLKDFPKASLAKHDLAAVHPDEFIAHQFIVSASTVCVAAKNHRATLRNPPKTIEEYLTTLASSGLPRTVASLEQYENLL